MKNTIKILNENNILYDIIDTKIYLKDKHLNIENKNIKGVLDVSMIVNLHSLICFVNQITEIKCNDNLEYLHCSYNQITEIKCNENLMQLDCSHNKLTKILCNKKLNYLHCYRNPIFNLNTNNISDISGDIYIYNDEYYYNKSKLRVWVI